MSRVDQIINLLGTGLLLYGGYYVFNQVAEFVSAVRGSNQSGTGDVAVPLPPAERRGTFFASSRSKLSAPSPAANPSVEGGLVGFTLGSIVQDKRLIVAVACVSLAALYAMSHRSAATASDVKRPRLQRSVSDDEKAAKNNSQR
jgi:hypothetical protein